MYTVVSLSAQRYILYKTQVILFGHFYFILDFAKAFEKAPHRRLLHKLECSPEFHGIDTLNAYQSFANKR